MTKKHAPSWSLIKVSTQNRFVQSMYIWIFAVPIVAKALSKIEESIEIVIFNYSFTLVTELPFSWIVFFFNALFFAIANALFLIFCPAIIREQDNYADFKTQGRNIHHLTSYALNAGIGRDGIEHYWENNEYATEAILPINDSDDEDDDKELKSTFWIIWDYAEKQLTIARCSASICYLIGAFLLGLVVYQNIATVVRFLI